MQQLRITPKFIQACSCTANVCHAYCITVKIIQTKRIYCLRCDDHYKLHLSKHNISIIGSVILYVGIILAVILVGLSICMLDGYIKCKTREAEGNRDFTSRESLDDTFIGFLEDCVDLGSLMRIQAIILPIICWSLYYSLNKKKNTGTFQAIVECLAVNDIRQVSRTEAKQNLHTIYENSKRRKIENVLFD